jgi:hypothetical protein
MSSDISDNEIDYTFNGLRDYLLLTYINSLYELMTRDELKGASIVIRTISAYLTNKQFKNDKMIDFYALSKTLEDLGNISLEILFNNHNIEDELE